MNSQTDEKKQDSASVVDDLDAPTNLQPLRRLEPEKRPESDQTAKGSPYQEDAWERLSFGRKVAAVGTIIFAWGLFLCMIGAIDKPEIIASSILGIAIGVITLNQYYVSKHQWFAMQQGLNLTDRIIDQNEKHFYLMERPALGVEQILCEPEKDGGCQIIIALINSGKTMAKITNLSIAFDPFNRLVEEIDNITDITEVGGFPPPEYALIREPGEAEEFLTSGILHNGGRKLIPYVKMNAATWENLNTGTWEQIYIWLKIQYTGIGGGPVFFTEYYAYYHRHIGGFLECTNHNDAT